MFDWLFFAAHPAARRDDRTVLLRRQKLTHFEPLIGRFSHVADVLGSCVASFAAPPSIP